MKIAVAIVEDESDISQELALLVDGAPDMQCVGRYPNLESAREMLPDLAPDVVLTDIHLPDGLGIELVGELSPQLNRTHFVMLTIAEDKTFVLDALGAGAVGYLLKGSTDEEIIKGIRQASLGLSPLSGEVARMMVDDIHRKRKPLKALECLTKREAQVLEQAALGLSDKEISTELNITLNTVNSHLKSIYSKLEIHSRAELIASYGIR